MILHELKATSSTLAKQDILKRATYRDKLMFQYAYDIEKVYNLSWDYIKYDSVKELDSEGACLLENILNGRYKREDARLRVMNYSDINGDLLKLITNKDLDCGVSAKTLNKVFGKGFISSFEVQLATEVPLGKIQFPKVAQIKYNGVRVLAHITNQGVIFKTRNGKEFEYPALAEVLHQLREHSVVDYILDGELVIGDSAGTNHTDVSGTVTSAIRGNPIHSVHNLRFVVFDALPMTQFYRQVCPQTYQERFRVAEQMVAKAHYLSMSNLVDIAASYAVNNAEEADQLFKKWLELGFEGAILKDWNHKYTFKRSKDWIKLKAVKTADLVCTGIQEGTGKYEGMIGALYCSGTVEGHEVEVDVGSGLTDTNRSEPQSNFIGHKIEVKYNEVIKNNATGKMSLFLPRFVTVRGDL